MTRSIPALFALTLIGCDFGGSYEGVLVDGMTGQPRTGFKVLARAALPDLTCQVREADVGPDGHFLIDQTCPDGDYTLGLSEESLFLDGPANIKGGEASTGPVTLKVWRAPTGSGLYKLSDDKLTAIRTFADVESATLWGTDTVVRYPSKKPLKLATSQTLAPGEHLIIAGQGSIDKMKVFPLIDDTGTRKFKGAEEGVFTNIAEHTYIGVRFDASGAATAETAAFDPAKVTKVGSGDNVFSYVDADALPAGRYAVLGDKDKRVFVLDFGAAPPAAAEAPLAEGGQ